MSRQAPAARLSTPLFLILQAAFWVGLAGLGLWHQQREAARRALPEPLPAPYEVDSLYDDPSVIGDAELARVLGRLGLEAQGTRTSIANVDHGLRFWGREATFADPELMSGDAMLRLLIDHRRFAELYGRGRAPLLIDVGPGVRVRAFEGEASSSHVDHTLASLAEVGLPLAQPIVTPAGEKTLRAMLEQSLRDFSLNQIEYEWSALSYALYLPPVGSWLTSEDQEVTFGRLADRIMREDLPAGVCSAHHRFYALVVFLRIDDRLREAEQAPILSPAERERIVAYLQDVTARLVRHQHAAGFWNDDWPTATPPGLEPSGRDGDELADRVIVTGHALEWWALAPPPIQPPREVVVRAAAWLVQTVDGLSETEIQRHFSFLSHAGRALALWRRARPSDIVRAPGGA